MELFTSHHEPGSDSPAVASQGQGLDFPSSVFSMSPGSSIVPESE